MSAETLVRGGAATAAGAVWWQRWAGSWAELTKARLTALVMLTTLVGFVQGSRGAIDWLLLVHTLVGTALVAGAASALNQLMEMRWDAVMLRTRGRPLPAGKLHPDEVLVASFLGVFVGLAYLLACVHWLAALVAALTLGSYVWVYTPLKRLTTLNTVIGAIPGALPPVLGWVAANGKITPEAAILFGLLFFWQMPHFLAIAWLCREDYARAGFRMLSVVEQSGRGCAGQALVYACALLPVSLMPSFSRMTGEVYFALALVAGAGFLILAWRFWQERSDKRARQLFVGSIVYLPVVLGAMALDLAYAKP